MSTIMVKCQTFTWSTIQVSALLYYTVYSKWTGPIDKSGKFHSAQMSLNPKKTYPSIIQQLGHFIPPLPTLA